MTLGFFALDVSPGRRVKGLLGMDILGSFQVASEFHKPLLKLTPSLTPPVVSVGIPKR